MSAEQSHQLALLDLRDDRRPVAERTADGRYSGPTLWMLADGGALGTASMEQVSRPAALRRLS
jgi:hypothetical protein